MQKSAYIAILAICSFHFVYTQNPTQDGQWSDPVGFGIVPVAVANLPDGRLITWSSKFRDTFGGQDGATFTEIFDPFIGTHGQALGEFTANTNHDMFCPGINNLPDGRILSAGGSSSERTSIYDPVTGLWEVADDMNIPRGYQGNVTLSDGSVFTLGGSWSGNGNSGARDAEIWTESTGWVVLSGIDGDDIYTGGDLSTESEGVYRADNHAWLWPASNGGLFHAGPSELMHWIDVSGNGSIVSAGQRSNDSYSMKGTTVMFDVDKILKVGGSESYSSGHPAKNNAYVIDINVPYGTAPNVTNAGQLSFSRTMHNSTVLPNGDVLVTGGLDRAEVFSDIGSRLTAELYNPSTNTWRAVAGMVTPRTYHSVAILMTDGRVFVGGGGLCDSTPGCVNHFDAEIYSPPYLFNGNGSLAARPIISAPDKANYNTGINVSGSANIQEFCLIRFSSATHSTNNEQRRIPVSHTQSQGAYNVNIPGNNLLPPGYYMLFALDGNGVPSIAETIQIGANVANNQDQSLILDIGFDEGQGTMSFDRSSFGNDLSFFDTDNNLGIKNPSSDNWGQGLFGGAMETDGYEFQSNTIGEVSHSQSMGALTNKITLMAWVNRDEVQHNVGIFSHDYPSIFFGFHNSLYKWEFPTDTGGEASCYAGYSPPGQWVHVAATYDGNNAILYANGVEISRMPVQGNFILNPNESNFSTFTTSGFYQRLQNPSGNYNGSGVTDELDGRIDELKVYNRVLSRNEIVSQYLQGQLQNNPNLADCSQNSIVAEYMIGNNGVWIEGNNIEVSDGETVYIRAKGYSGEYFLTTPQKDGPTFSSVDDLSNHNAFNAYQIDTYVYNFGNPERNNGLVDPTNYGKFVLTTADGCPTVVNLNTEIPSSTDCPPGTTQVIQEYRLDGEWLSGSDHITVAEGTEVMLSILPNTLGVSITLPNGTVVGDDYNLGNVDISDSGDYLLTSSEGCTVTLTLQVTSEGGGSAPVAVATASPLTGNPPLEVSFTGSGSTDDVGVVSHSWDFGDGGSSTLADPVHTYSSPGSYTATLTVEDGEGETDVDTVSITVTQEGTPGECTALSAPWSNSDVGSVLAGGSACSDGQTYEVSGSGADIWGSSDGFHYVYQQLEGDLEISARVVSLSNTDNWAKAGVMVRNNLSGNSAMALMSVSPDPSYGSGPGYTLQHRSVDGGTMTSSGHNLGPVHVGMPYYVRLVREGDTFSGYASANGTDWSLLGSRQIPMGSSVYVGLAVTSHKNGVLADAVLDNVTVTGGSSSGGNSAPVAVATASPLTGNPPLEVSFTGSGSTDDVGVVLHSWDFGDGGSSTLADPVHTYSSPGSYTATLTVEDGEGETDIDTVSITVTQAGNSAPVAVATASPLTGNPPLEVSFTGSGSTDDVAVVSHSWDFGDGGSSTLADPVHTYSSPGSYTATLTVEDGEGETDVDTVSITVTQEGTPGECTALSAPWSNSDVGSVLAGGSACSDGQTYEVSGSGADIWGSSDGFHYVYQQLEGDLEITARVVSLSNTDNWAKAGVMVRNNLSGNSAMALMSVSPDPSYGSGPGYTLQHRSVDGGTMTSSGHNLGPVHVGMPYYVRLVREGDTFSGYASANGTDWSLLGSRQIPMGSSVYVGLAVTSHKNGVLADAVLDNVTVSGGSSSGGNSAPVAVATASPLTGNSPLEVSFTGSGSTDDVGVVSHSWDFGDGGSSTLADPVHTYSSPGSYTATLTVQDGEGRVDSSTIGIVVTDPNYCETGTIIPEYRLDGVWSSGLNDLTVVEGTEVMFSILPNTVGVTVTLADGTVVGDDFNLGPVTVSHSGPYVLLSSEGCETTINLTVLPDTLAGRSGISTGQVDQSSGGFTFNSLESLGTRIFPNPTSGYFKISNYELVGETVRVMIYGTSNRLIFEKEFPNFPGEIELESLYFFQDGIYRVLVSSSNHLTSHSLILKK